MKDGRTMFKKWLAILVTMTLLVGMAACSLADGSTVVLRERGLCY